MRTLVIGDIHGCLQEFKELLHVAAFRSGDRLILLGDLVDRGPDSAGVLRYARELNAECILGNHEEKHLRWRRHERLRAATGKKNPMKPFDAVRLAIHRSFTEADWAYMEAMPYYVDVAPRLVAVHGGLERGVAFASQRPNAFLRCRWVDKDTGKMKSIDPDEPEVIQPPNTDFWTEVWKGPENVLYGHHVHSKEHPRIDSAAPGIRCVGLDTGCCFGGRLTGAMFYGDEKIVDIIHVEAGQAYASWRAVVDRVPGT